MPRRRGLSPRQYRVPGGVVKTTIAFLRPDFQWLEEQAVARGLSLAGVLGDCIAICRERQEEILAEMDKAERRAARQQAHIDNLRQQSSTPPPPSAT